MLSMSCLPRSPSPLLSKRRGDSVGRDSGFTARSQSQGSQAICGSVGYARDPQYTSLRPGAARNRGVNGCLEKSECGSAPVAGSGTVRLVGPGQERGERREARDECRVTSDVLNPES